MLVLKLILAHALKKCLLTDMLLSPNSLCCLRRRHLTNQLFPVRTPGPSHSTSTWITQESDIDFHGCHSSHQPDSLDTGDEIHYCDLHGYPNTDHLGRFGLKITDRPRISSRSPPSPRCLGYTLLPQRPSTLSFDWETSPVEHGLIQSPSASVLSPSVVSALEGVTYIAEHLRAEDADFSVSADVMTIIIILSNEVPIVRHLQSPLLSVSTGEGGLEVCSHGCRPDLPVDVHYRVSAGDSRTLPASVALWDVLEPNWVSKE